MRMDRQFAVFILSHGRADNVKTIKALTQSGYTGRIYIIIDDEDEQRQEYINRYGKSVIVFNKQEAALNVDVADLKKQRNVVVYARNQCHSIANKLGLTHFVEMDDDYSWFSFKQFIDGHSKERRIHNIDEVFDITFDFLDVSGAAAVCCAQGGDYIGGALGTMATQRLTRKAMNVFFCKTDRLFKFYGRLNEDTTAYTRLGQQGILFFTFADWMVHQEMTQQSAGGLTDAYLDAGTYVKSFYSVMFSPSCVRLGVLGDGSRGERHERIHHRVIWGKCTPKIISSKYKK